MIQTTVQAGQFALTLNAHSSAYKYWADFIDHLPQGTTITSTPTSSWRLTLVSSGVSKDVQSEESISQDARFWIALHRAWASLASNWKGASLLNLETQQHNRETRDFVFLISEKQNPLEIRSLLRTYVFTLKGRWLIQNGWLPIHASAVMRREKGLVFLGKSGAGKSTVARMSLQTADSILHDEKIFLRQEGNQYCLFSTPRLGDEWIYRGGEIQTFSKADTRERTDESDHSVPLCAIFILHQDTSDYLTPVSNLKSAHALVTAFLDMSANVMPKRDIELAMGPLSDLARRIPCYELHFRKSPDFWKVIDEQFPD